MTKKADPVWAIGQSRQDDRGYNQGFVVNEATRVRAERRCDYMISRLGLKAGDSVMEIGCGPGLNSFMLTQKTGASVLGTDLCVPFIEEARQHYPLPNLRYEVRDFNDFALFEGETFDGIVGNGILHHLYYHLDTALVNMRRLLKPGGRIVFLEPNLYNPYIYLIFSYPSWRTWARLEPDEMAFTRSFITQALAKAGYRKIVVEFRDFLLPGIPSVFIQPSILLGSILEKIPVVKSVAQSLFISAEN